MDQEDPRWNAIHVGKIQTVSKILLLQTKHTSTSRSTICVQWRAQHTKNGGRLGFSIPQHGVWLLAYGMGQATHIFLKCSFSLNDRQSAHCPRMTAKSGGLALPPLCLRQCMCCANTSCSWPWLVQVLLGNNLNSPISYSARHQRPARERHKIHIASRENVDNQTPRSTNFTH